MFGSSAFHQQYCSMSTEEAQMYRIAAYRNAVVEATATAEAGWLMTAATEPSHCSENPFINDTFPFKLHLMLSETDEQGVGHIISWQPHGRCFIVYDREKFVKQIMPNFFRMSKYESFQRQLNIYGFRRVTAGRDKGGYYHESFLRGRDLCCEIQCRKIKGTFVRKPATITDKEPNFYRMPISNATSSNMNTKERTTWAHPTSSSLGLARFFDPTRKAAGCDDVVTYPSWSLVTSDESIVPPTNAEDVNAANYQVSPCSMTSMARTPSTQEMSPFPNYCAVGVRHITDMAPKALSDFEQQHMVLEDMDNAFDVILAALRGMDSSETLNYQPIVSRSA